ncbi:radical SAM protein [Candidatus Woesearchaeota archaeon]|nr:radical SAM protein [Candidatus Woesearchaeota archaeon]
MSKAVLVNYSGKPIAPGSLIFDNGMGNLAGSLVRKNHDVLVLDYGTVDTIKKFKMPEKNIMELKELISSTMDGLERGKNIEDELKELYSKRNEIEEIERKKITVIAEEISDKVHELNADFVGFKLWNGDGFIGSVQIAEKLRKEYPELLLFAGGPHVDWFREKIYKRTDAFDAIAYGEGEETIVDLAEYAKNRKGLEDIPNLIFKQDGKIKINPIKRIENLDDIAMPVYDEEIYPSMKGDQKIKFIVLDESRGCPNNCNFCIQPIKSGRWRVKSAERVVNEMEEAIENYGIHTFRYGGSNTPIKTAVEIAKKIIEKDIDVDYNSFGHARTADYESYKILKESGCFALFFGIESGSQYILDESINKRATIEQQKNAILAAKKAGIFSVASIIFPAPLETEQTKQETLDFLFETRPDSTVIQFPGVYIGTEWARNPEKYNIELTDPETFGESLMNYKIRLLFPTFLWDPLPYKVNGKTSSEFTKDTTEFTKLVEKKGIPTAVADDIALMAYYLKKPTLDLRDDFVNMFSSNKYNQIQTTVKEINKSVLRKDGR